MHLKPTVVLYGNWCLFIDQQMAKTIFDLSLKKNLTHKTKQNIDILISFETIHTFCRNAYIEWYILMVHFNYSSSDASFQQKSYSTLPNSYQIISLLQNNLLSKTIRSKYYEMYAYGYIMKAKSSLFLIK